MAHEERNFKVKEERRAKFQKHDNDKVTEKVSMVLMQDVLFSLFDSLPLTFYFFDNIKELPTLPNTG